MSYADAYADMPGAEMSAANADVDARGDFIFKTYLHVGGALLAFIGLCFGLVMEGTVPTAMLSFIGSNGQMGWLMILGAFMLVSYLAQWMAFSGASKGVQYGGLGIYVAGEAVIMSPLLMIAGYANPAAIPVAAGITAYIFVGLTAVVFITRKDFGFMGPFLYVAMWAALGLIVASALFSFSLGGIWFAGAMALLMCGVLLYQTSEIMHRFPIGSEVAASLALFGALATLFWYILQIVLSVMGDD